MPLPDLTGVVTDIAAAKRLGKALFWDMQVGSDGVQACASCHFHAGADFRSRNQINPGPGGLFDKTSTGNAGPNYALRAGDFPLHRLLEQDDNESFLLSSSNDRVSSMGVFRSLFVSFTDGASIETGTEEADPDNFALNGVNVRRVEPRNTPTVINSIFAHRLFHDGRASNVFNGVNPFGAADPDAGVLVRQLNDTVIATRMLFDHAAAASQAVGPPGSPFEMSFDGRTFEQIGKKLLQLRPLNGQLVANDDSLLGAMSVSPLPGLGAPSFTYRAMVEEAFASNLWSSNLDFAGFDQAEKNFALFFGLSVLLYESTLVADDSPYDQYMDGGGEGGSASNALTVQQKEGLDIFLRRGRCIECHVGPEFAGGTVTQVTFNGAGGGLLRRAELDNGLPAVIDNGYFNIGVRPTAEDVGVAGIGPFGAFSLARRAQLGLDIGGPQLNPPVGANERLGISGAFRAPTIRNIELTGPFMHNGGLATLEQVVDFYTGGAHFAVANAEFLADRVGGIGGMSDERKAALVAFMKSLTDERVRLEKAPFDHPQLFVPDGHAEGPNIPIELGTMHGVDVFKEIPAVGQNGGTALQPFHTLLLPSASVLPNTVISVGELPTARGLAVIVLDKQPTQDVRIDLTVSDPTQATVTPSSLTFTPANWNAFQLVTATGRQDGVIDPNTAFQVITSAAISTDPQYSGLEIADIQLRSIDSGFLGVYQEIEAESGVLTGAMVAVADATASGGQFIRVPNGTGNNLVVSPGGFQATYTFNVPVAGTYRIWVREHAPTTADDTFWVRMDNGVIANWTLFRQAGQTWVWDRVNNTGLTDPMTYNLTAGQHTLRIKHREDGGKLDKLIITNDASFVPGP